MTGLYVSGCMLVLFAIMQLRLQFLKPDPNADPKEAWADYVLSFIFCGVASWHWWSLMAVQS